MAVRAINIASTKDVELSQQLDPAAGTKDATKFIIGALDSYVMAELQDGLASFASGQNGEKDSATINFHEVALKGCRFGLRGWKNFLDENNNEVAFKTVKRAAHGREYDVVDPEVLRLVPIDAVTELYRQIRDFNTVSVVEAKNSEPA
jgi:hypothetical protein